MGESEVLLYGRRESEGSERALGVMVIEVGIDSRCGRGAVGSEVGRGDGEIEKRNRMNYLFFYFSE